MQCPRCQHANQADSVFCQECGARLERTCPSCGTANQLSAKFCRKCGQRLDLRESVPAAPTSRFGPPATYTPRHLAEKILTSRSALEGERKQVTVLFVDVSGFTALSEQLDPEDVYRLMSRAFELMLPQVHQYEGTVNQFLGDGIMALFGAPIAHEDHAQRAVHAALGIRRALEAYQDELERQRRVSFAIRQGLNTGLVVVGGIGSDLRMDYTAVGDTTNVAARLQQGADRGRIVVSEATHRLVEGYFHTRPLGGLTLKGKDTPVRAWEVIAARQTRTRLEVEAERGLTPYVGRQRELAILTECFEKARAGHGQVVFVAGEPGIGKSRLLYEFRRWLDERATWVEGRCVSFGRSIAFHPIVDMLKRNFRIEETDTEGTILQKVEHAVLRLGEDLRPILPYLKYVLSVDAGDPAVVGMDAKLRRAELFDALRRLLVRAAQVRPQVFVVEDLHWMDKATEECLLFVADSVPGSRILQVLTYRPGYVHPFGERTYHTRLALDSLSAEDSAEMTRAALAVDSLPGELQALIVRKAEGNPLFVEEVVKSLQEVKAIRREGDGWVLTRHVDEVLIPDTIQDVIMARIDRLEEAAKQTLQLASVIGREFTKRLLARIADLRDRTEDFLHELKALELIYEKSLFPELAYMFKHALTHEVAYNSLLVQRRRELHQLIALAIEELYADRLAEHAEVLGYHFLRAEDWARALEHLRKAAEKATRAYANREALALADQALEAARHLGEAVAVQTLMKIHEMKADLHLALGEFDRARAESGSRLDLARRCEDRGQQAAALSASGFVSVWAHDFDRAIEESRAAIALAEPVAEGRALARASLNLAMVYGVTARLAQGKTELERVMILAPSVGDHFGEAMAQALAGLFRNWEGEYAAAARLASEAIRRGRENSFLVPLLQSLWISGLSLIGKGAYDDAMANLREGLALAEKVGEEINLHRLLNTLGWLWAEVGDAERATHFSLRGAERARKRGFPETIANSELNLADLLLARGDLPAAAELLDGIMRLARDGTVSEWMKWRYSTRLFASLGDLALARGDTAKAREWTDQCLEVATRTNARKNLVKGWRLRGEIAMARRQWDDAEAALREALAIAQAIGNPTQLWKTHVASGRLNAAMKRADHARQSYQKAREVIDDLRESLRSPELRASLERTASTQQIYDLSAPG
jgi:class 3 adenylate cyclase/tetratricopeptide (TPR) repeat protein